MGTQEKWTFPIDCVRRATGGRDEGANGRRLPSEASVAPVTVRLRFPATGHEGES